VNAWDDNVIQVSKGWFNETCAKSPVQDISFLRMDGDLFVSTWDVLVSLYQCVLPGGSIYIDDYSSFNGCRTAVDKFRSIHHIYETMHFVTESPDRFSIDGVEAVWWQKAEAPQLQH
jgi:hypothetical protein